MFHDVYLMDLIKRYGTPLKLTYLPKISSQIQKTKMWFKVAMVKANYNANYNYCYCTKSSLFSFVIEEALKNDIHLETSSAFDINIIEKLIDKGAFNKDRHIICNGFKLPQYIANIARLANNGNKNIIPILDNKRELADLDDAIEGKIQIGIRIASEESPKFDFYTSRLGIGYKDIVNFYNESIKTNPKFELKRSISLSIQASLILPIIGMNWLNVSPSIATKKHCPTLDSLNIGGGLPIKNSLSFNYDYEYMIEEIISQIKSRCDEMNTKKPNLFTEFGSFTVGESGAAIYQVVDQKDRMIESAGI